MRIMCISDVHIGCRTHGKFNPYNGLWSRTEEFLNVLEWSCLDGINRGAERIVIIGDLFDNRNPSLDDIQAVRHLLAALPCPVHIVAGNHEIPGLRTRTSPLDLLTHPLESVGVEVYRDVENFLMRSSDSAPSIGIALPYPTVDQYIQPEERRGLTKEQIQEQVIIRSLGRVRKHIGVWNLKQAICFAHIAIEGSIVSEDMRGISMEYEYPLQKLNELGVEAIVAGHVHYYQEFDKNIVYCGSPVVPIFGESYQPGYLLCDIDKNGFRHEFVKIPAGVYVRPNTYRMTMDETTIEVQLKLIQEACRDKIARIYLEGTREQQRALLDAGILKLVNPDNFTQINWVITNTITMTETTNYHQGLTSLELIEDEVEKFADEVQTQRIMDYAREITTV